MARSFLFNKLKDHTENALDEAFKVACEMLRKYSEISKITNLYGSKNAYNNILAIYNKKENEIVIESVSEEKEDIMEE